jgi:hypothetical protein
MRCFAVIAVLFSAFAGPASAQPALPAGFEEAQRAFLGLPAEERRNVQLALVWTGDFSGLASGEFGRLTYQGIAAFQRRQGVQRPNAILTSPQRQALDREATRFRTAARFEAVTDPRTGARIGVPVALVQPRVDAATGSRWAARDRRIVIETVLNPGGERDLDALYSRYHDRDGQTVDYRLQRPDFFVLTGQTEGERRFYTRLARRGDDVVGYTMTWTATARDLDRINVAIANAFEPGQGRAQQPTRPPVAAREPVVEPPAGPDATAIVLSGGRAVTPAAAVQGCRAVLAGGRAVRVEREVDGLAVLAIGGDAAGLALAAGRPEADAPLVFLGVGPDGVAFAPTTASRDPDGSLSAVLPLAAGQTGGALLDRSGGLVAVVLGPRRVRTVAIGGVVPAQPQRLVEASALAAVVGGAAAPSGAPRATADIVLAARGAVLPVSCRR